MLPSEAHPITSLILACLLTYPFDALAQPTISEPSIPLRYQDEPSSPEIPSPPAQVQASVSKHTTVPLGLEMPGLSNEVQLISVAPGQTFTFEISVKNSHQGFLLWSHHDGKLIGGWGWKEDDYSFGAGVPPIVNGEVTYSWTNQTKKRVILLLSSWAGEPNNCSGLRLLIRDPYRHEFSFGGGVNDKYNQVYVNVRGSTESTSRN